jgi:hypothetical protein
MVALYPETSGDVAFTGRASDGLALRTVLYGTDTRLLGGHDCQQTMKDAAAGKTSQKHEPAQFRPTAPE